jgi:FkbM family methyltransferase
MTERRKIFIDCGANRGQSVKRFRELFPDHADFEIYCFEPDREVAAKIDLSPNWGVVFPHAAWVSNGFLDFYPGPSTLGSSLYADKTTGTIAQTPVKVSSIDLGRLLKSFMDWEDFIVLKMNVEGAEYPVLRRMLDDGTLTMVDRLFVRWHQAKIPSISEAEHLQLVADIAATGLAVEDFWNRETA